MIVIDEFMLWGGAILLAINLGVTVWNLVTSGSKKNGEKLDALGKDLTARLDGMETSSERQHAELEDKMRDQDKRLSIVENEMEHLPTKDQVSNLHISITQLEGTIREMGASLQAVTRTVGNIDTYLRKDSK